MSTSVLLSLVFFAGTVTSQQTWPLLGQGLPPPGRTVVLVDTFIDALESINSNTNSWTGHVWFHLQWNDTRAPDIITNATANWVSSGTCNRPCDWTNHASGGCCDGVFLPHLEIPNLIAINQEMVYTFRIWTKADKSGVMQWSARISADFHSPFDFRAWPFEHQHLLVELQIPPSIADRVALGGGDSLHLQNTPHTKGPIVPGWNLAKVTKRVFDYSACYNASKSNTSVYNITGDEVAMEKLSFDGWAQSSQPNPEGSEVTSVRLEDCQFLRNGGATAEDLSQYGPRYMLVDTMVKRIEGYYVMANIVPLLLLTYMVFVTYAMERSDLEARMGVVVTLVLSISALQFTWDFPPASYLNAVQQITLMAYGIFFLVAIESMIASHICRLHMHRRQNQMLHDAVAAQRFNSAPSYMPSDAGSLSAVARGMPSTWAGPLVTDRSGELPAKVGPTETDSASSLQQRTSASGATKGPLIRDPTLPRPALPNSERIVASSRQGSGPVAEGLCFRGHAPGRQESAASDEFLDDVEDPGNERASRQSVGARSSGSGVCKPSMFTVPEAAEGANSQRPQLRSQKTGASLMAANFNLSRAMSISVGAMTKQTKAFQQRIDKDEAYALLFARRMDIIFCWFMLVSFTIIVIVLLYVNGQVGDHKMMLIGATAPANM